MRKSKTTRKGRNNRTTRRRNRRTMKRSGGGLWDSIKNAFSSSSDTPAETQVMNNETLFPRPNETEDVVVPTNTSAVVTGGSKKRRNKVRK